MMPDFGKWVVTLAPHIHTLFMPLRLIFSLVFNIVEYVLVANNPIRFCERKKRRESELLVRELSVASENGDLSRLLNVLEEIIRGKKTNDGDVASMYPIKRKNV